MAQRAGLKEGLLAVKRRRPPRPGAAGHVGVTLQTEQIHVAHPKHVKVRAPVGNVAGRASLDLDRFMLEHKGTLLVGMAGEANGVLSCRGPYLLGLDGSVRIMAIRALNQTLIHAMVKWHCELSLLLQMAGITEFGLRLHQQILFRHGVVG